jgi:WD40 repeat protein
VAVSPRLKATLIHPNRTGFMAGLRYSPDGKRIIAGQSPAGVIQVWDAATGKQLTRIDTAGFRGTSNYFYHSPDWKTLYAAQSKTKGTFFEKGGKKWRRWQVDGGVRAWDLDTGKLTATFREDSPRAVNRMVLSPDGSTFATFEELSGESEHGPGEAASLWDVKTRKSRPLPAGLRSWAVYTPDGKTLAAPVEGEDGRAARISLIDVATAREKRSIALGRKEARVGFIACSPDGKLLVGRVWAKAEHWVKFWDLARGKEVASFEGEKNDLFMWMAFSPDGRTLAVTNSREGKQGKLFLFDVPGKKLRTTTLLGEKAHPFAPAFSPDGRWIAVPAQVFPAPVLSFNVKAEDLTQPRIHLIDAASGQVRETIVSAQAMPVSLCFSPDRKTLATGGHGRVLLWDLTRPPLADGTRRH